MTAGPGLTVQFTAALDDVPVPASDLTWAVSDTALGTVSPAGLFATSPCWDKAGPTEVRAVLQRDSTKRAVAQVTVVIPAVALVQVRSVSRSGEQVPVDLARATGDIDVTVAAGVIPCHDIAAIQLEVSGPAGKTLVGRIQYQPARNGQTVAVLTWHTAVRDNGVPRFPNGEYRVVASVIDSRGRPAASNTIPLTLDNP